MSDTGLLPSLSVAGRGGRASARHETSGTGHRCYRPAWPTRAAVSPCAQPGGPYPSCDGSRADGGPDGTRTSELRGPATPLALGAAGLRRALLRAGRTGPAGPADDGRQAPGRRRPRRAGMAQDALKAEDLDAAKVHVAAARAHVDEASTLVNGFGGDVWRWVPVGGGAIQDVRHLVGALDQATAIAEIGTEVYPELMQSDSLVQNAQVDLDQLDGILTSLNQAGRAPARRGRRPRGRRRRHALHRRQGARGPRPGVGQDRADPARRTTRRSRSSTRCPTCSAPRATATTSSRS